MIEINKEIKELLFLGPKGSYCEEAKNQFVENFSLFKIKQTPFNNIKNIIKYLNENENCAAILPVENSVEGIVRETLDNLITTENNMQIFAETVIPIQHSLLARTNDINKIKKLISHPQALAQCQNFISQHLSSDIELIEKSSTSKAAEELSLLDESYAAIANEKNAKLFNLNILKKNINDEPDNKTRFIFLSKYQTNCTGQDKTSLAFTTQNKSGALVKILKIFDSLNVNLLYIDSRPSKKHLGEYIFFVDFEGHINEETSQQALSSIKNHTSFMKVLGSYQKF